jgi:predicted lipoprotein with Yx(FWY)xxD motif
MNKKIPVILGIVIVIIALAAWALSMKAKPYAANPAETDANNQTEVSGGAESINAEIKGPIGIAQGATGSYIVTKNGMTLYVNVKDENPSGTVKATCSAACEANWPPYLFDETVAVDQTQDPLLSKINVFERSDGKQQYAIGTQPLYTYVGDKKAGDTTGLGVGTGWMIAKP